MGVGMVCMCGVILMCVGLSGGVFLCLVPFCPVGRIIDTDGYRMLMCVVGGICPACLLGAPYFCDFCRSGGVSHVVSECCVPVGSPVSGEGRHLG